MTTAWRIAVIIPAYNEERFIKHCLDRLNAQTVPAETIFVVDNNSTDLTARIAGEYQNVTILKEPVQGICAATKKGMDAAAKQHTLLLRCDADCRPELDWIERIVGTFDQHPEASAVTGPGVFYDAAAWKAAVYYRTYMLPYFICVGFATGRVPLFGSNMAMRAETWRRTSAKTHLTQRQDVHDDIDITYHLPDVSFVRYERTLTMPISARPFTSLRSMKKRYVAGFASITTHWPEQSPIAVYRKKFRAVFARNI